MMIKIFLYFCYAIVIFHIVNYFIKLELKESKNKIINSLTLIVILITVISYLVASFHVGYMIYKLFKIM